MSWCYAELCPLAMVQKHWLKEQVCPPVAHRSLWHAVGHPTLELDFPSLISHRSVSNQCHGINLKKGIIVYNTSTVTQSCHCEVFCTSVVPSSGLISEVPSHQTSRKTSETHWMQSFQSAAAAGLIHECRRSREGKGPLGIPSGIFNVLGYIISVIPVLNTRCQR